MGNEFQISGRGFDYPGEPLRELQIFAAERIEGRWERNFPSILAFVWPLECSYSISAEDGAKWGVASFPSAPLSSVAEKQSRGARKFRRFLRHVISQVTAKGRFETFHHYPHITAWVLGKEASDVELRASPWSLSPQPAQPHCWLRIKNSR